MNIVAFLHYSSGGIAEYSHFVLAQMAADGHHVTLMTAPGYKAPPKANYEVIESLINPIPSTSIKLFRVLRFVITDFVNVILLARYAWKQKPDVVLFETMNQLTAPLWAPFHKVVKRYRRCVYAQSIHDVDRYEYLGLTRWNRIAMKAIMELSDVIITHSALDQYEYSSFGQAKIVCVPMGILRYQAPSGTNLREFRTRLGCDGNSYVALIFGFLRKGKHIDLVMQAIKGDPSIHLIVAGAVPTPSDVPVADYMRMAQELGIEKRVTFLDRYVSEAEVATLFQVADLVVIPYDEHFKGQSAVLNIAAGFKKPVLVSAGEGPLKETMLKFRLGVFVEPRSARNIMDGIAKIRSIDHATFQWDAYEKLADWKSNVDITMSAFQEAALHKAARATQ